MIGSNQIFIPAKRSGKTIAAKEAWIKESQRFQTIARNGGEPDSYESIAKDYDDMIEERRHRLEERKLKALLNVTVGKHY